MTTFLIAMAFLVVGVVAYVALRNAQDFSDANEIVPGVPTNAPKAWAGAHTPEARMHRRLRDAVLALRSNTSLDDPAMTTVRTRIEEEALGVDERLVAAAALPKTHRDEPLQRAEKAVEAIEAAVAGVVDLRGPSVTSIEAGIREVETRVELVEAARAELEGLSSSPSIDALRAELEAQQQEGVPEPDDDAP